MRNDARQALEKTEEVSFQELDFVATVPSDFDSDSLPANSPSIPLVFTSARAVEYAAALFPASGPGFGDAFCLEGKTYQKVAEWLGADRIIATAPDSENLAKAILHTGSYSEVLFFCGNQRLDQLPDMLSRNGITVHEARIYSTVETPEMIDFIPDAILFFSPSAVSSFLRLNPLTDATVCFAIGQTTAASIRNTHPEQRIITPPRPGQEAMVDIIYQHFQLNDIESTKK